jgi:hypothetical protein
MTEKQELDELSEQVKFLQWNIKTRGIQLENQIRRIRDVLERMNIACEEIGDSQTGLYECLIDLDEILKCLMATNGDSDFLTSP